MRPSVCIKMIWLWLLSINRSCTGTSFIFELSASKLLPEASPAAPMARSGIRSGHPVRLREILQKDGYHPRLHGRPVTPNSVETGVAVPKNPVSTELCVTGLPWSRGWYSLTRSLRKQESQNPLEFLKVWKAQPDRPLEFLKLPRPPNRRTGVKRLTISDLGATRFM